MLEPLIHSVDLSTVPTATLYSLLEPCILPIQSPRAKFSNWSKTFQCSPALVFEPSDVDECRFLFELARRELKTVRIVGEGHSPSDLPCTSDFMLRTSKLNKLRVVDSEKNFVIVDGGIRLDDLQRELAIHNLAMRNLASISTQGIGGVITTATHGTGITFKVLGDDVLSLYLLLADGSLVFCSRSENHDLFLATLCGLGSTGLVISVQLQVEPAFRLRERQETKDFEDVIENLDEIVNSSQHVRLWWYPQNSTVRVSSADRTFEPADPSTTRKSFLMDLLTHHLVELFLFFARFFPWLAYYIARYVAWMESAPRMLLDDSAYILNMNCRFPQYTTEWAIPFDQTRECLLHMREWLEHEHNDPNGTHPNFPIEIRFSDADDIWLSPSYGRVTCWIGIIQYKPYGLPVRYQELFRRFENIMTTFGGRPHWAKPHHLGPSQLRSLYPHFDEFVAILEKVDPTGMFRNEYIRRHFFGERGPCVDARMFKQFRS